MISSINFCQDYDINLYDFLNYLDIRDFKDLDTKYLKLVENNLIKNINNLSEHRNYYQVYHELDSIVLKLIKLNLTSTLEEIIKTFCYEDNHSYEYINFKKV